MTVHGRFGGPFLLPFWLLFHTFSENAKTMILVDLTVLLEVLGLPKPRFLVSISGPFFDPFLEPPLGGTFAPFWAAQVPILFF